MRSLTRNKLALVLAMAFAVFGYSDAKAVNITQQVKELKQDYEYKLKQYTNALKEGATSVANNLSKQVKQAKEKYDKAVKALTPSQETKDTVSNIVDSAIDTTTKVMNIGSGGLSTSTDHEGKTSVTLPNYDKTIKIEGDNYCGQYAMTNLLNALGKNVDGQKVYEDTNPWGIFTSPTTITEYLNMNGVDASQRQNAKIEDLAKQIDSGYPALVLMSSDDKGTPHWVCVYGYETDANGNVTSVKMRDSYWGTSSDGFTMDIETFQKRWASPLGTSLKSNFVGYKNLMITVKGTKEPEKSPRWFNFNFTTATEDNVAGGINDVVTGARNLKVTQVLGGSAKLVLGLPGAALGVASNGVGSLADKGLDWGVNTFKQSGAANKIAGAVVTAASGALKVVSTVGKAASNVLSGAASIIGNGIKKLGYVFR